MRPFTLWTRPIVAALRIDYVSHITFDTDVMDATCDRWISSGSSHCPAMQMRHVGSMHITHYVADGPDMAGMPPLPSL